MPIVDIEIVLGPDETIRHGMVSELADEIGTIFHSASRRTWVRIHSLPAEQYAENGGRAVGVYPIFVSIIKSTLSSPAELQKEVEKITGAVAQICNRPSENVHVLYQPEGRGRVAFGGKLVL